VIPTAGVSKRVACVLCCLLAALLCATGATAGEPVVIVLSLDGVRADQPARAGLPGFARLAREGARAEKLVPVFPPMTFPGHVTLATGAPVDRHGIVANVFRDRARGEFRYSDDPSWLEAEPIWATAERQGVPSAVFFWVSSGGAWHGVRARYLVTPFDTRVPESEKVDRILSWLDLPAAERPRLILSWWHGADAAGHRYGPDAPQADAALAEQDAQLVRLLDALDAREAWADTTLLVVSDHGMAAVREGVDLGAALETAGIEAEVLPGGGVASIHLADPAQRGRARAVLAAVPGVAVFASDALPERWRYGPAERLGDLVATTEPPREFRAAGHERSVTSAMRVHGAHGFDPGREDMAGIFYARGRGVARGAELPAVSSLDVAPTIARLLGIGPPRDSEGQPLDALLLSGAESPTTNGLLPSAAKSRTLDGLLPSGAVERALDAVLPADAEPAP
jgi:predicted AlkP superfamily pyrophosphatase or phosphodiesterase